MFNIKTLNLKTNRVAVGNLSVVKKQVKNHARNFKQAEDINGRII